jgi:hypothetical protein
VKTTIDIPEDLLRLAKAEAARGGCKFRELVAEALRLRLGLKKEAKPATGTRGPLLPNFDNLPLIKARPGARKLKIPQGRIHELEMEAELERHRASHRN